MGWGSISGVEQLATRAVQIPFLLFISCVTLGWLPNLSQLQFLSS